MTTIKTLRISWLNDEKIKKLSFGEIKNSKTLNSSSLEPEIGGLFCPQVFGPAKSYQCACRSDQSRRIRNQKCENCGVLIAHANVRRWRMGHVALVSPVTNTLVLKSILPHLEWLLGISSKAIKDLIYFNAYVVLEPGYSSVLKARQILARKPDPKLIGQVLAEIASANDSKISPSVRKKAQAFQIDLLRGKKEEELENELNQIKKAQNLAKKTSKKEEKLAKKETQLQTELDQSRLEVFFLEDYLEFLSKNWKVKIETGSLALKELLKTIDLPKELKKLDGTDSKISPEQLSLRKKFLQSLIANDLSLTSLVWNYVPILPAGLRPATKLDDGSVATTQQNNLDRKLIFANERLKRILEINKNLQIPILFLDIVHNEQRRLQRIFDQRQSGEGLSQKNSTKSLLQILSGKEGILRKYSLGKRVDFSARSVISPNPSLTLNQVGIPTEMALTLYRPFLLASLLKKDYNLEEARAILLNNDPKIFPLLNEIILDHPVLLNRAPTLHRLGMQGFQPVLTLGKTVELHPLVTVAFNADFDGDQMAVLLPLTKKAREEVKEKAMANLQVLDPKNGNLVGTPAQDIILGIYYLTRMDFSSPKENKFALYYQISQLEKDYEKGRIDLATPFFIPLVLTGKSFAEKESSKFLLTTLGKWKFNQILPPSFPYYLNDLSYYNQEQSAPSPQDLFALPSFNGEGQNLSGWRKKEIIAFLNRLARLVAREEMVNFLDQLKELGFTTATQSGISISLFDLPEIETKKAIVQATFSQIQQIENYYQQGFYSEEEFIQQKNSLWEKCKKDLENELVNKIQQENNSSLYYLWDSGARASTENLNQIFGMQGNVADYQGKTIETPILSSLKEGLNPFEFFISVYGAMKGMMDTALKTAEAGYLTRQLIEAVQNIIVLKEDCQTSEGIYLEKFQEDTVFQSEREKNLLISLKERIIGRYLAEDVQVGTRVILAKETLLLEKEIALLEDNGISKVKVRSPFTCFLTQGICQKCYGCDLSKNQQLVELGTAVGIIAAQSLGEPGTQLTMWTFHTGGVAGDEDIVQGLPKVKEIFGNILPSKKKEAVLAKEEGEIVEIEENEEKQQIFLKQRVNEQEETYTFDFEKKVKVKVGQIVKKGESLTIGKINLEKLLEVAGREACQNRIREEVWRVYYSQGVKINEKHIELFTRQMLSHVEITNPGESQYLIKDLVSYPEFCQTNRNLKDQGKQSVRGKNLIFSLKQIAKNSPSFLASISFQETSKSLINYSIFRPVDELMGLKENLIVGQLAPIGWGLEEHQKWEKRKTNPPKTSLSLTKKLSFF